MCIENFQFVFDGKSIDVGNGKRSKSSNEEEVALEAIYWYQCKCKSNANQSTRSQDTHIGGNASPPATKRSNFVFLLQNENEKRVFGYEFQFY
jgi:hypothetical protein